MGRLIEELDYRATAMGPLILRRRWVAAIDADVIEVILGEEHLMSSLFTVGETELAVRGLAAAKSGPLRVLVGGLGLGYTAGRKSRTGAALPSQARRLLRLVRHAASPGGSL
jgi:hypothetical protein